MQWKESIEDRSKSVQQQQRIRLQISFTGPNYSDDDDWIMDTAAAAVAAVVPSFVAARTLVVVARWWRWESANDEQHISLRSATSRRAETTDEQHHIYSCCIFTKKYSELNCFAVNILVILCMRWSLAQRNVRLELLTYSIPSASVILDHVRLHLHLLPCHCNIGRRHGTVGGHYTAIRWCSCQVARKLQSPCGGFRPRIPASIHSI